MASNYVAQLVAEYYEYRGYFVRRNVQVGLRAKGGYECELDVIAYDPTNGQLVQVEPSMDADTWPERERRYAKKFDAGRKYIPQLFAGLNTAGGIEQIALFMGGRTRQTEEFCGGRIVYLREFLITVLKAVRDKPVMHRAVPEQYPILRTMQLVNEYREYMFR